MVRDKYRTISESEQAQSDSDKVIDFYKKHSDFIMLGGLATAGGLLAHKLSKIKKLEKMRKLKEEMENKKPKIENKNVNLSTN